MKKILLVLLAVFLLGGGYYVYSQKSSAPSPSGQPQPKKKNVITSIKDALAQSMSLACEYPDEKGNTITTYIKGSSVRIQGYAMGPGQGGGQVLMKDKKMYIWDDVKKQGTVIAIDTDAVKEQAQKMKEEQAGAKSISSDKLGETIENLEKIKDHCKVSTVADSMFTVPTDVTFVDVAEQMKKSGIDVQKIMEEAKKQASPTP